MAIHEESAPKSHLLSYFINIAFLIVRLPYVMIMKQNRTKG